MDFACLLMMAYNNTFRRIESDLRDMRTPWDGEPVPDHTTMVRHLQTIPPDWDGLDTGRDWPPLMDFGKKRKTLEYVKKLS